MVLLKQNAPLGSNFVYGFTSPNPRHVMEAIAMALCLHLVHPDDTETEPCNSVMDSIRGEKGGGKVNKGNEVSTVNKKFIEVFIEGLATAFLFDYYGPVTLAPKHWVTNGTPPDVSQMILHNQNVLIDFCFIIDAWGASYFFPGHKNPCSTSIGQIYQKRHTIVNKMKNRMVSSYSEMKQNKGALWVHQFFICQAFMEEAEITKCLKLYEEFNLLDTNDSGHFVEESGLNEYGTVLRWVGKEVEVDDDKKVGLWAGMTSL